MNVKVIFSALVCLVGWSFGVWQFHSEMPGRMMDNAAVTDGNYVYVLAGRGTSNVVYRHAVGSNSWDSVASCPLDIYGGGAALIGDTIYYCSGFSTSLNRTVDTLFKYCISTNTWTSEAGPFSDTTYNWKPLVFACQGKLYHISGCTQRNTTNPTRQVWCYTPGVGWERVADMNQGRVYAHGCVYHDTIWVTGGNANNAALNHSEFYDPVSNTWTVDSTIFPSMPVATWGGASGNVGPTMFVFSGASAMGTLMDTTQYFNFNTKTWTVAPSVLLRVYRGCGVGNADGKAVVYGGSPGGYPPAQTDTCQYEQISTGLEKDVGVVQIVTPGSIAPSGEPVTPRARIKNFGTDPQSDIPVYCWIESLGVRVYEESLTYPGPLEPGATADVDFSPDWYPVDGTYEVTMFTNLNGDQEAGNDTLRSTTMVVHYTVNWSQSDTIVPHGLRRTAVCADAEGKIHILCGYCFQDTTHPYEEIYDPVTSSWTRGLAHPGGGVYGHDAVRIGSFIWCGGGASKTAFFDSLTKLDLNANTWTVATGMPDSNLIYYAFEKYPDSGWIYCFGGVRGGTGTPLNTTYRYSIATNSWTRMADMPAGRRTPMATRVGDTIYLIGGMSSNNNSSTRGTVWKYSVLTDTWVIESDTMPDALGASKALTHEFPGGTFIYVVGGYRRGSMTDVCWRYEVDNQTWNLDRPLIFPTGAHSADISKNYIWVVGGGSGLNMLNNVQKGALLFTGVAEGKPTVSWGSIEKVAPSLVRNYCRISYYVPTSGRVNLSIYDVTGVLVRSLVSTISEPGNKSVTWDCRDAQGKRVASGTYFYRLTVNGNSVTAKAILLQ